MIVMVAILVCETKKEREREKMRDFCFSIRRHDCCKMLLSQQHIAFKCSYSCRSRKMHTHTHTLTS